MLHALFSYNSPIWLNHRSGSQNRTYLSTYLPTPQNFKSLTVLVLEKQAANKDLLHHIQGEVLLLRARD